MKRAIGLAFALAAGVALPAAAQDGADKTRLDEFALPASEPQPDIEQLQTGADPLPSQAPPADRQLTVSGPAEAGHAPVAQLSQSGETAPAQQVGDTRESRDVADRSVSSAQDSRPQAATALAGRDRCDPGLEDADLDKCRAILERRAAQFDAPEAPRLSAEQILLAEQGQIEPSLTGAGSRLSLRIAAGDPDPDVQSNQELAAVYLNRPGERPAELPPGADETLDPSLIEALQGLQIDLGAVGGR